MRSIIKYSFILLMIFGSFQTAKAQSYTTGAGLMIDFGDDATLVGPHLKHYLSRSTAGELGLLFGNGSTAITAMYMYTQPLGGVNNLDWYAGVGPNVIFGKGKTSFAIVPALGLDYKIEGIPFDVSFDWRPKILFGTNRSDFLGGRFGLGLRYVF